MPKYQLFTVAELPSFDALRGYVGQSDSVCISDISVGGVFVYDPTDTSTADDGDATIVANSGKRWKRVSMRPDAQADAIAAIEAQETTSVAAVVAAQATAETAIDALVTSAETAETNAETAQAAAETARDAALAATKIYADTTAGLAGVASGEYFYVPSAEAEESLILYKDNAGVAQEVKRYLSSAALDFLDFSEVDGVAWCVADDAGNAALSVLDDGTVEAAAITTDEINGITDTELANAVEGASVISTDTVPEVAWAVSDENGYAAIAVLDDGTTEIESLTVETINGLSAAAFVSGTDYAGTYQAEIIYFNNTGQSLGEGSNGNLTTAQEYDNIGFAARASSPVATVTLTVANTEVTGRGESPMYGALGHIKALIQAESGLAYTDMSYQLLACNNGYSGYALAQLNKGTVPYNLALSQVTSGYSIAQTAGKTFMVGAMFWTQGETNAADTMAAYRDALKQLALDWDTDTKAITGQTVDVPLICYQTATNGTTNVALGQLAAANESDLVYMACPMYQFDYYDVQHINAISSKWLGAYYGLVYKRVVIDGEDWSPVQPLSHVLQGNVLLVTFNVPVRPLVLDTTLVPAQTNYGFTAVNSASAAVTINSVEVVGPATVKFTLAASVAGGKLRYGHNTATGKSPFVGGCGNLRDSQGDDMVYEVLDKPMHNWCVIFEYSL